MKKAQDIRKILTQTWPQLGQIWIFDQQLKCLPVKEIETMVIAVWEKMKNAGEKLDCDDQALFLHAAVKKRWALNSPDNEALCFGEVAGTMFQGWSDTHNQNIAVADDGKIWLIEPQTKEMWPASPNDDKPYWVRF